MKIKNTIKFRPFKFLAILFWMIGFPFSYLAQRRVESRFGVDTFKMGYGTANMSWLQVHYGTIGIAFIALGLLFYLIQHHKDANNP